jgi:Coenzyme PQQ synthesis protein D (PqqD)
MTQERTYECNSPDVVFENFGDETVIINLRTGHYYSLDPVGMALWDLISRSVPIGEVAERAAARYKGDAGVIAASVDEFTSRLAAEGLIRLAPPGRDAAGIARPAELGEPSPFTSPVVSRYEDMAEMLLLDPIHDVTDRGWPSLATEAPGQHAPGVSSEPAAPPFAATEPPAGSQA